MSAVLKPGSRPYSRDYRPQPKDMPPLTLAPLEPHGWKVGRVAPMDRASDAADREYAARCNDIRTRHWRELDACTVGDVAHDERLAEVLRKGGAPADVGKVLLQLVHERIEAIVRSAS